MSPAAAYLKQKGGLIKGNGLSLNVGCGPHRAVDPWINFDIVDKPDAGIEPDYIAHLHALPVDDGSVFRLYAGHTIEHLSIHDGEPPSYASTFTFSMLEVKRVLDPEKGVAAFVCPDVYRAIQWYRDGRCDFELVDACLEGPDAGIDPASAWDGCFHAWNCHEARLLALVKQTFPNAIAVPLESSFLDGFPIVSRVGWQCAVLTRSP